MEKRRRNQRETILFFKRYDFLMNLEKHLEDAAYYPEAYQKMVKLALPTVRKLIHLEALYLWEVRENACIGLSFLSNCPIDRIQVVIDLDILERLVLLLNHGPAYLADPLLETVGNMLRGSDSQIQVSLVFVIEQVLLPNESMLCFSLWIVLKYLVNQGCIEALHDLLTCQDRRTLIRCLDGLKNILKAGQSQKINGVNPYAQMIDAIDGFPIIENLQIYPEIGDTAKKIINIHWRRA
ncbi:Importin subunit alpha [Quillaja saponaria]|uniref:Importin subunit alpha n=1 Tax=Quillaja saponaria TaxID=32244 RepID=A0AAD7LE79_QUISA|nr:Importin subunit alpha [Quillaja saponaria]